MIVCSCNALTDTDVTNAVRQGAERPREVYASKNCKAQCGNCVPGVLCMLREARKAHAFHLAHVPAGEGRQALRA
ncbi:(2Fe-2S)-binding protein [Tanticharoenia sakaeratensis]|uniref:(2Fe-2S)-binding protein n=1 Tax=Tanticharoenia sakaeratensis TaxID=444053 RepID=UPI0006626F92|nr:(2Fe-2S)-binding protein [Tanticharoenia sakaeratensis]GBQ18718.1 bacterioferritin-associated ferredoxin [Tanticharoenia sakaeratensis NBRC 103193]